MTNCFVSHKQFRAFTLLELLIGMIVSGIVLSAGFSAWRIVSKEAEHFRAQGKSAIEISFFKSHFTSDFHQSDRFYSEQENEIRMIQQKRVLIYQFSADYVLRKDGDHTDTFFVSVKDPELFSHDEKAAGGSDADEIRMILKNGKQYEPVYFIRTKSSRELIENELNEIRNRNGH